MDARFFSREARSRILDGIQITKEKENLFFEGKKKKEARTSLSVANSTRLLALPEKQVQR